MGNLKDLMAMIPGVGKAIKDVDISDDAFKGIEAIIKSMTPFERANPDEINPSRKQRIAKGCGKDISDVNAFMKQFDQMRQMMKMMNKMPMGMGKMPGMPGMGKDNFKIEKKEDAIVASFSFILIYPGNFIMYVLPPATVNVSISQPWVQQLQHFVSGAIINSPLC